MKIYVFTSTSDFSSIRLLSKAKERMKKEKMENSFFMRFPERMSCHPTVLYDGVRQMILDNYKKNVPICIATWDSLVFDAVRVIVKEANDPNMNCKCFQYSRNPDGSGNVVVGTVLNNGLMDIWVKGCLSSDVQENALMRLL